MHHPQIEDLEGEDQVMQFLFNKLTEDSSIFRPYQAHFLTDRFNVLITFKFFVKNCVPSVN